MMFKKIVSGAALMAVLSSLSCTPQAARPDESSTSYYSISHAEILDAAQKRPIQSAYELIEYLRPRYLRARPQHSVSKGVLQSQPIVYMNNVRFGTVSELHNINYAQISQIKYLRSSEATQRFGLGHEGGAIVISTR